MVSAVAPHRLQESLKLLSQSAESKGQEDTARHKFCTGWSPRHEANAPLGCHRWLSCMGLTQLSAAKKTLYPHTDER